MKTIEVSEETYEKIKDKLLTEEVKEINTFTDLIGQKIFFRTVSYFMLGRVKKQIGKIIELENASWIPCTGRFMQFIKDGKLDEVEPTGQHFVNSEMIVDFFIWKHDLPKDQK